MNLEEIGKQVVENGKAIAVQTAIMKRMEEKVTAIGEHNGKQDIQIANVSACQKSTQNELKDHKKDTSHHPNGNLTTQVKNQWVVIIFIAASIMGLAFYIIQSTVGG